MRERLTADKMIGGVIPAAGSSSRYGRPKLLLPFKGKTLVGNTVDCLTRAGIAPIIVVCGPELEGMYKVLPSSVQVIHNLQRQQGMGNSIALGVREIQEHYPQVTATLIALPDQPLLTVGHIHALIRELDAADNFVEAVATLYGTSNGVPALFSSDAMKQLRALDGDQGARGLLQGNKLRVRSIAPDFDLLDIDTESDYQRLLNQGNHGMK